MNALLEKLRKYPLSVVHIPPLHNLRQLIFSFILGGGKNYNSAASMMKIKLNNEYLK